MLLRHKEGVDGRSLGTGQQGLESRLALSHTSCCTCKTLLAANLKIHALVEEAQRGQLHKR